MERPRLAIVVPAYDEAATIGDVVRGAVSYGAVIVVDDHSQDATAEHAGAAGAHVVRNEKNLGYDRAIERGFAEAERLGAEAVVTLDADGEHDTRVLADFRRLLVDERRPLVLGVRPRKPRFSEWLVGLVIRRRYGIADVLCGMKGYHLELYRQNRGFDHVRSIGTELAIASIRRGHPFVEVPVSGRARGDRPRFGNALSANARILAALWRVTRATSRVAACGSSNG